MSGFESLLNRYLNIPPQSEYENTLRLLIRMGLLVTDANEGSLLVLDQEAGDLRFAMTIGSAESEAALRGQRVPLGQGITGLAAATLEGQIGAPTYKDVQQSVRLDATSGGPEAVMAAPMLAGSDLVGVITAVSFARGRRFTTQDGKLFGGFAAIGGVLVDQARRLARVKDETDSPARTAGEGPEARIARSIAAIARSRPAAMPEVATLLGSIERLVGCV
jgi:GAF domain-containing protein